MKSKISLLVMFLIMVLPVMSYAIFKAPNQGFASEAAAGKPMVIEFSAPLCLECKKLGKVLEVVEPKFKDKVVLQKISVTSSSDKSVEEKVKKYQVKVVPTMIFINAEGTVIDKTEGSMPAAELEKEFQQLINGQ